MEKRCADGNAAQFLSLNTQIPSFMYPVFTI